MESHRDDRAGDELLRDFVDPEGWGATDWAILKRMAIGFALVAVVYVVIWRSSYALFAPEIAVARSIEPGAEVSSGEEITLGAMVRNSGRSSGSAFVVATTGDGLEVEGETVEVPAGDSVEATVEVSLGEGGHSISLTVFDSWRGVRRLETFEDLWVEVGTQVLDRSRLAVPSQATRGDRIDVAIPWTNRSEIPQTVRPVVVFRSSDGGAPVPSEGPQVVIGPDESRTLRFDVDTWALRPGAYSVDVFVRRSNGQIIGRSDQTMNLEVTDAG